MGIRYTYRTEKHLMVVVWDGEVNFDQWREHVRRFLDGPEYPLVQYQLADLRDASVKPYLTEVEIGRVVKYM